MVELQLDWDLAKLAQGWPTGPDTSYLIDRVAALCPEVIAEGSAGRVLEVAAAEAEHACRISLRGIETFVVEPSPVMLERARQRIAAHGATVVLVRGVAEGLPFRSHTFDRVLLDSAIDHLGEPALGIREMTRVLKPDGRLVITFINYEGASARTSRRLYRIARRFGVVARDARLFWDSPVPLEHTFECTTPLLRELCAPHLELDQASGVSIGWMVPGWRMLLERLSPERGRALMRGLDRVAHRMPRVADFVISVWKPRRPARSSTVAGPARPSSDGRGPTPHDTLYATRLKSEAEFWGRSDLRGGVFALGRPGSNDACDRMTNRAYTGDPTRSWLDDLIARGPYRDAAILGCDEGGYERRWLTRRGSTRLDVYDLSPDVLRTVRRDLAPAWRATHGAGRRVRFIRADLSVARLPEERYDVIWSSGCLHHLVDLEHLLAEVERALRPGGLFAIRDYVGERRMQFSPERLARVAAALREVPARYRRRDAVGSPHLSGLSPFCAVRSDAILPLVEARFEVVHKAVSDGLPALYVAIDLDAIEREAPDVLARLEAAEREALRDPALGPCTVYAVFRVPSRESVRGSGKPA
jgi:SAM-dependent methyltransferase